MATELDALVRAFRAAPDKVERGMTSVIRKGAVETSRTARRLINSQISRTYLKHYPNSITYEMTGKLSAEIGADASMPQGGMSPGVEFGSAKHGPLPHHMPAADEIEPKLDKATADLVARVLE